MPPSKADLLKYLVDRARALFRGLKRPIADEGDGQNIYVYVLRPPFAYQPVVDVVCPAKRVDAPQSAVFVVYARFGESFENGEVINWEWVLAAQENPELPKDYQTRYEERIW